MTGLDFDTFLKSLVGLQNTLSNSADRAQEAEELAHALENTSFVQDLYNQCQASYAQCMDTINSNPTLSSAKAVSGQVVTAITSPAAQITGSLVLGGLGGPVGLGIALGAATAQVAAGASFVNTTKVMHDEAVHLTEYAGYSQQKSKIIEDIHLKCMLEHPDITEDQVKGYLEKIGVTNIGQQVEKDGKQSPRMSEEEIDEQFKSNLATNLTMNALIAVLARPAILSTVSSPVAAASLAVHVGQLAFSSYFQTSEQMTEALAQEKINQHIENLRRIGPEYQTHVDIDPSSLEANINAGVKSIKERMGYKDESDPTKRAVSRKDRCTS